MRTFCQSMTAILVVAVAASLCWLVALRRQLAHESHERELDRQAFVELGSRMPVHNGGNARRMATVEGPESAPENLDRFNAALDRDPVWASYFRKLERRRILSRYDVLLTALKVPPDQVGPLEDLLVDRAIASRNAVHKVRESGQKFGSPALISEVAHATDEVDAKIAKLVGPDVAKQLWEWNSAIYSYGNAPDGPVAQDAVTLREAGFELSPDQMVKMALIHYEVFVLNFDAHPAPRGDPVDPSIGLTRREDQLFKREAAVLTPDEIAVLRKWTAEEHQARAVAAALRVKYGVEPPPPPPRIASGSPDAPGNPVRP